LSCHKTTSRVVPSTPLSIPTGVLFFIIIYSFWESDNSNSVWIYLLLQRLGGIKHYHSRPLMADTSEFDPDLIRSYKFPEVSLFSITLNWFGFLEDCLVVLLLNISFLLCCTRGIDIMDLRRHTPTPKGEVHL
jgi:hypothetical protein